MEHVISKRHDIKTYLRQSGTSPLSMQQIIRSTATKRQSVARRSSDPTIYIGRIAKS